MKRLRCTSSLRLRTAPSHACEIQLRPYGRLMQEARGQLDVESGLHGRDKAETGVEWRSREADRKTQEEKEECSCSAFSSSSSSSSEAEEDEEEGCGGSSECEDEGHAISEESAQSISRLHYKTCHQSIACMSVCSLVAFFCQGSVRVARDARLWPDPQRANAHDASGSFVTDSQYLWLPLVISRVVGVVVFGHLGDTRGRRLAVTSALVVVGVSTLLMAFLPTEGPSHSAVGVLWALLTALQSMGVAGEWAGAIVIPYELCQNDDDRCIGPSIPYAAMPLGFGLGAEAVDALWRPSAALPQLPRLAFVLGGLAALGCGWWATKDGREARTFRDLSDNGLLPVVPLFEVLWVYPLALVMGFLTLGMVYLIQNFVNRAWYFLLPPQRPSVPMLCLTLVVISVFILLGSILACFVTGRRGLYMAMCLVIGLGVYPWILGEPAQTSHYGPRDWVAVGVLAPMLGLAQGPIPSLLADMFDTSTLMTGLGLVFWGGNTVMNTLWPALLRLPHIEDQELPQSSTPPSLPPSVFALLVCVVALVSAAAGCLTRCIDFGPPPRLTRSRSLHVRDCIGLSRPSSQASPPSLAEEDVAETGQEQNARQVNEVLQRVARSLQGLTPVREEEEQTMSQGEEETDEEAGAEELKQAPRGEQHHSVVPRGVVRSGRGHRHRHRRRHRDMGYRLGAAGGPD